MKNRDMKRPVYRLLGVLCAGVVCCILGACSDRADESGSSVPDGMMSRISLQSGIMPIADTDGIKPQLASELNVKYSDSGFSEGDSVGFFSRGGKIDEENNSTNFLNLPLVFNGYTFNSEELSDFTKADPGRMERIFSYYPYTEGAEGGEKVADIYAKGEGAEEEEKDEEGHVLPLRVIDFLTTNISKDGATMNSVNLFYHTFAIVRVALGEGFKDFKGDIYLQLERKVKGVWIDMDFTGEDGDLVLTDITSAAMKLKYDDMAVSDKSRRLKTFNNGLEGGDQRWDVIVPCRSLMWWSGDDAETCGVTVQAIVLCPEDGSPDIEIPVDNYDAFVGQMGGELHGIRGSYIYTVRVEKNGFNASVFPVDVQPWTTQKIKETIPVGIGNEEQYKEFIQTYNKAFDEDKDYSVEEIAEKIEKNELTQWGDVVNDGLTSVFTVFLTADIDLTGMDNFMIHNLVIPIDGRGNTIRDCHLNGSFCNRISTGGSLKNLRFENLHVVSEKDDPIGLLAGTMVGNGSFIDGCRVTGGLLEGNTSETKVGAAVGKMENGEVRNCVFGGFMYGTNNPSYDDLVGDYQAGSVNNNNRNNMTVVNN